MDSMPPVPGHPGLDHLGQQARNLKDTGHWTDLMGRDWFYFWILVTMVRLGGTFNFNFRPVFSRRMDIKDASTWAVPSSLFLS